MVGISKPFSQSQRIQLFIHKKHMLVKAAIFWDVMCKQLDMYQYFIETSA